MHSNQMQQVLVNITHSEASYEYDYEEIDEGSIRIVNGYRPI